MTWPDFRLSWMWTTLTAAQFVRMKEKFSSASWYGISIGSEWFVGVNRWKHK